MFAGISENGYFFIEVLTQDMEATASFLFLVFLLIFYVLAKLHV